MAEDTIYDKLSHGIPEMIESWTAHSKSLGLSMTRICARSALTTTMEAPVASCSGQAAHTLRLPSRPAVLYLRKPWRQHAWLAHRAFECSLHSKQWHAVREHLELCRTRTLGRRRAQTVCALSAEGAAWPDSARGTNPISRFTGGVEKEINKLSGLWGRFLPMVALFFSMSFINTAVDRCAAHTRRPPSLARVV